MKTQWQNNWIVYTRVSPCHIGLVKDHGGQLVNQPRLSLYV